MATTHPIEVPVCHPSEIDHIFDVISYAKGASVLRMLHEFIGEDTFIVPTFLFSRSKLRCTADASAVTRRDPARAFIRAGERHLLLPCASGRNGR